MSDWRPPADARNATDDRSGGAVWLVFVLIFLAGLGLGIMLGWRLR